MSVNGSHRPSVTVHNAQSLDGRLATRTGHSQWLGCERSLRLAHQLRATHDAIAVGLGTVLADDPRLTCRLVPGASPTRVVLDSELRTPLSANLVADGAAPTLMATTSRAPLERVSAMRSAAVEVEVLPSGAGGVDLPALLRLLVQRGVSSLLVEGGGRVITSLLQQGLVDRVVICITPKLIGTGIDAVGDLGVQRLEQAIGFSRTSFTVLDEDVIFDGTVAPAGKGTLPVAMPLAGALATGMVPNPGREEHVLQ